MNKKKNGKREKKTARIQSKREHRKEAEHSTPRAGKGKGAEEKEEEGGGGGEERRAEGGSYWLLSTQMLATACVAA